MARIQPLAPCGTEAAYRRHIYRGEPIDAACGRTQRALIREYQAARQRALKKLARLHHDAYRAVYDAAKAATGRTVTPEIRDRCKQTAMRELAQRHDEEYQQLLKQARAALREERELAGMPPQEAADRWNRAHPVGAPVLYWTGRRTGRPRRSRTRSPAWVVSDRPVVAVDGVAGGIALTHISVDTNAAMETESA